MPKPEILDPQGQAVHLALRRLGSAESAHLGGVRQGKRFELEVDGEVDDTTIAAIRDLARDVLSNPVIEDVVAIRIEELTQA